MEQAHHILEQARQVLKDGWGYDSFRGIQEDIIVSILQQHDTLGLMPTGGGKSITFQVPTLCMEGLCVVVTPLIALMKDQVLNLRRRNILAEAIFSGMSHDDMERAYANCIYGHTKFLYVSPERLSTEQFLSKLKRMKVCLITVDEAHCISQWGYDFRPAYLRIAELRKALPEVPILALTATATPTVASDICKQLGFGTDQQIFRMSFERENLSYLVRQVDDKYQELTHILTRTNGSAIIYTRNRMGTRELAEHLNEEGFTATYFHAGLTTLEKDMRQKRWLSGEKRIMVATNAFGMGIDKPDVRLVIHMDLPDSVEAYFQEAGRAGRDGQHAWAVLLCDRSDLSKMQRRTDQEFPPKEFCAQIYDEIAYFFQLPVGEGYGRTYEFSLDQFCRSFRHFPTTVESALKILTHAGYITYQEESEGKARLMMLTRRDDFYYMHHLNAQEERVLQALFRLYSGIFSEYVFVEESTIAIEAELTPEQVYNTLISLTKQRLLNYVPRKRIPRITYEQRRIESERLYIGTDIYEDRRKIYAERIAAITGYATEHNLCRSRYLLEYFGEKHTHNCGHCDICRAEKAQ